MRQDTFLGRLGATGTLSLGYQVLYVMGIMAVVTVFAPQNTADPEKQPWQVMFADGTPLLTRTKPNGAERIFRSLDDQPVTIDEKQTLSMGAGLTTGEDRHEFEYSAWSHVRLSATGTYTEPWFFIQERIGEAITGYFVAYSNATRMPVLYLGANGQSVDAPLPEQRFQLVGESWNAMTEEGSELSNYVNSGESMSTNGRVLVLTTTGLECVDLNSHIVSRVVSSNTLSRLGALQLREFTFGYLGWRSSSVDDSILLRGLDTVFEIKQGKIATSYIIPQSLRKSYFMAYLGNDGTMYYAMVAAKADFGSSRYIPPDSLLKCDKAGQVLQQWAIKQPAQKSSLPTNLDFLCITALFPAPLTIVGTLAANNPHSGIDRAELVRRIWPSYLVMFGCGILSVIGAWKLAPRFSGAPVEWGWMVYVFLFGLPGLVGYLMHFRRRRRPLLAPAPQLGTEVFA